ncbi:hypothetical protein [Delftia tsuruhatensis]|uniref:hypothetical protein n=1 Tax=Delftia tsuruhatensis TaxID=180282 RepID=UPI001F42BC77|nr:hypothetical protein [Delftia tsuruhatensis]
MNIKINTVGLILSGEESGNYVKIIEDFDNTSGFLILTSKYENMSDGYDNWVENIDRVRDYVKESGWEIRWIE